MNKKRISTYILTLLTHISVANAITGGPSPAQVGQTIQHIGRFVAQILQREEGVYIVTLIFSFILFYAVYSAPLKRVGIFQGAGGLGLNAAGKLFCIAATGLTCTAIFAFRKPTVAFLNRMLTPFGGLGILLLALVIGILVFRSMRDEHFLWLGRWGTAFLGFLVGLIFFSWMTQDTELSGLGITLVILFLLITLIRAIYRHFKPHRATTYDVAKMESKEQKMEQKEERARAAEDLAEKAEQELQQQDARRAQEAQQEAAQARSVFDEFLQALGSGDARRIGTALVKLESTLHHEIGYFENDLPEEEQELLKDSRLRRRFKNLRKLNEQEVRVSRRMDEELNRHMASQLGVHLTLIKNLKVMGILEHLKKETQELEHRIQSLDTLNLKLSRTIINRVREQLNLLQQLHRATPEERNAIIEQFKKLEVEKAEDIKKSHAAFQAKIKFRMQIEHNAEREKWFEKKAEEKEENVIKALEQEREAIERQSFAIE